MHSCETWPADARSPQPRRNRSGCPSAAHLISDKLLDQTLRFTKEMQALLNGTIANHVQIKAVTLQKGDDRLFLLGHLLDKKTLTAQRFPLRPRAPKVELWMDVSFQMRL